MNFAFKYKINQISSNKQSRLVLALDPSYGDNDLLKYGTIIINDVSDYICAIKLNFHMILPMSKSELQMLTSIAHDKNIAVIADMKLNDIYETNKISVQHLSSMGFDCVIINPFIGKNDLKFIVDFAHSLQMGIISLVYMSHGGANEGFGRSVLYKAENENYLGIKPFYHIFYENAVKANVDGIVVGGNRYEIIKELSGNADHPSIYSPGIVTQGGDVSRALKSGSDYLIIGRYILNSDNPLDRIRQLNRNVQDHSIKKI